MNATIPPAALDAAFQCLDAASDPASSSFWPAIHRLCDIERTIPTEARAEFYAALSDHHGDGIDDCPTIYRPRF